MPRFSPGRIAVPLLTLAAVVFLASCGDSLTEITPADVEPLYDDGMACAEYGDGGDCTGGGGEEWPPSPPPGPPPGCMPINGCGGGPGGGGGDPDGGGGYKPWWSEFREAPVDTIPAPKCPLQGDDRRNPALVAWCGSNPLNDDQYRAVSTALDRMFVL